VYKTNTRKNGKLDKKKGVDCRRHNPKVKEGYIKEGEMKENK
jgi:hypothetical protein